MDNRATLAHIVAPVASSESMSGPLNAHKRKFSKTKGKSATFPGMSEEESETDIGVNYDDLNNLFENKVHSKWYQRYYEILPEKERIEHQPSREVNRRKEDIAMRHVYGLNFKLEGDPTTWAEIRRNAVLKYQLLQERKAKREEQKSRMMEANKDDWNATHSVTTLLQSRKADIYPMDERGMLVMTSYERGVCNNVLKYWMKLVAKAARQDMLEYWYMKGWTVKDSKWAVVQRPKSIAYLRKRYKIAYQAKVRERFRTAIKVVYNSLHFLNVCAELAGDCKALFKFKEFDVGGKDTEATKEDDNEGEEGKFIFDASKFKFTNETVLDTDCLFTLTMPCHSRTEEDIRHAIKSLQLLRCFAELPAYTQKYVATVAWYIKIPESKMVIRQCHEATNCYILLSGRVIKNVYQGDPYCYNEDGNSSGFRIIQNYTRDSIFGEEALTKPRSIRTYSVITARTTNCEVLSISVDDFFLMTMNPHDERATVPEHIKFISTCAFLKTFPKIKLVEEAENNIFVAFFREGTIVEHSAKAGQWVYVVKHGSCRALVELKPPPDVIDRYRKEMEEEEAVAKGVRSSTFLLKDRMTALSDPNLEKADEIEVVTSSRSSSRSRSRSRRTRGNLNTNTNINVTREDTSGNNSRNSSRGVRIRDDDDTETNMTRKDTDTDVTPKDTDNNLKRKDTNNKVKRKDTKNTLRRKNNAKNEIQKDTNNSLRRKDTDVTHKDTDVTIKDTKNNLKRKNNTKNETQKDTNNSLKCKDTKNNLKRKNNTKNETHKDTNNSLPQKDTNVTHKDTNNKVTRNDTNNHMAAHHLDKRRTTLEIKLRNLSNPDNTKPFHSTTVDHRMHEVASEQLDRVHNMQITDPFVAQEIREVKIKSKILCRRLDNLRYKEAVREAEREEKEMKLQVASDAWRHVGKAAIMTPEKEKEDRLGAFWKEITKQVKSVTSDGILPPIEGSRKVTVIPPEDQIPEEDEAHVTRPGSPHRTVGGSRTGSLPNIHHNLQKKLSFDQPDLVDEFGEPKRRRSRILSGSMISIEEAIKHKFQDAPQEEPSPSSLDRKLSTSTSSSIHDKAHGHLPRFSFTDKSSDISTIVHPAVTGKRSHGQGLAELSASQAVLKSIKYKTSSKKSKPPTCDDDSVNLKHSEWKLKKLLVKGDQIGFEWVNLHDGNYRAPDEDPSIVSNGAELVMIRKEFIIKYLNVNTMCQLHDG